jgi:hypothetical protein
MNGTVQSEDLQGRGRSIGLRGAVSAFNRKRRNAERGLGISVPFWASEHIP